MLNYLFKPGPSETAEFSRRINISSIGHEGESFSILGVGLSALDASQYRKIYSCFRTSYHLLRILPPSRHTTANFYI